MKIADAIPGTVVGRFTIESTERAANRRVFVNVVCVCGSRRCIDIRSLGGDSNSCGCLIREITSARHARGRGGIDAPAERSVWRSIRKRCRSNYKDRDRYFDRGIAVCAGWDASFRAFYEDMGPRPSTSLSIDRENNDGGYWCGRCQECIAHGRVFNCRWATAVVQANNTRRTVVLTLRDVTLPLSEWAARCGIKANTLYHRIKTGWSVEDALATADGRRGKAA